MEQLSEDFVFSCIQPRAQESHKGSYGHVLLAAGSRRYRGAANLAAEGALRSGAGIVTLAAIEPVIAAAAARLPECCLLPCPEGADGGISAGAAAELLAAREKAGVLLMGPGMGNTSDTRALVRALVDGAACTVVLDADGLNAAAALLAAGGMAIGMALSGTVQNFAGGIMILVFKPFKAGDFIETENGYSGTVSDVNIFSTKLTTTDNRLIIIPNGSLSNGTINNYSQNRMRRVEWLVGVEYGTDAKDVKARLQEIVDSEKRVLFVSSGAPADPLIAVNALKDSAVEYVVRVWVKSEDYWDVYYTLNEKIYTILPQNGIGFPYPHLDVTLSRQDS